jgi:hypothetical protein
MKIWQTFGLLTVLSFNTVTNAQVCDPENLFEYELQSYDVAGCVVDLAIADFNNDGHQDIATISNCEVGSISIILNNGDATFADPIVFGAGSFIDALAAGDLDGDGDIDIAIIGGTYETTVVFLNDGLANFSYDEQYGEWWTDTPVAIALVDVENDGDLDMLVGYSNLSSIRVFVNAGFGEFEQGDMYVVGDSPDLINSSDLNLDGFQDIVIASASGESVGVLMNNGDGIFVSPVLYHESVGPVKAILFDDQDSDGDIDIVVGGSLFRNVGSGAFIPESLQLSMALALGDLDSDGDNDLIAGDGLNIFLHTGNDNYANSFYYGRSASRGRIADFNSDGKLDIAIPITFAPEASKVLVHLGNGDGTLASYQFYQATTSVDTDLLAADLNGDQIEDAIVSNVQNDSINVLINNSDGTFTDRSQYEVGRYPVKIIGVDIDNDGDTDLVTANNLSDSITTLNNNGSGIFAARTDINIGTRPLDIDSGDFDNDGDVDLVTVNKFSNDIIIMINTGNGIFGEQVAISVGAGPRSIVVADFDSDDDLDLAVVNTFVDSVSVLRNDGHGGFSIEQELQTGNRPWVIAAEDIDADGDLDLALVNEQNQKLYIYKNDSNGYFASAITFDYASTGRSLILADIDHDSDIDVVLKREVLLNPGNGNFIDSVDIGQGYPDLNGQHSPFQVADVDGDTDLDLVHVGYGGIVAFINQCSSIPPCTPDFDGNGVLNFFDVSAFLNAYQALSPQADLNGDGNLDFFDISYFLNVFNSGC